MNAKLKKSNDLSSRRKLIQKIMPPWPSLDRIIQSINYLNDGAAVTNRTQTRKGKGSVPNFCTFSKCVEIPVVENIVLCY